MNPGNSDKPKMEDYGSSDSESDQDAASLASVGKYSGGTEGVEQSSGTGEQFGEFANSGQGTDLTVEMENSDARSGLVKGGEAGADGAGGLGRYGGESGGVSNDDAGETM